MVAFQALAQDDSEALVAATREGPQARPQPTQTVLRHELLPRRRKCPSKHGSHCCEVDGGVPTDMADQLRGCFARSVSAQHQAVRVLACSR